MARRVARYCDKHMPAGGHRYPFSLGFKLPRGRMGDNPGHYPEYSDDLEYVCPVCFPPVQLPGGILTAEGPINKPEDYEDEIMDVWWAGKLL